MQKKQKEARERIKISYSFWEKIGADGRRKNGSPFFESFPNRNKKWITQIVWKRCFPANSDMR